METVFNDDLDLALEQSLMPEFNNEMAHGANSDTTTADGDELTPQNSKKERVGGSGTRIQKEDDLTLAMVQNFFSNFEAKFEKRQLYFNPEKEPRKPKVDYTKIDWLDIKRKTGIDVTKLDERQTENLLNGKKTDLLPIRTVVDGKPINTQGKLSIGWDAQEQEFSKVQFNYVKQELNLDEYCGYKFNEEEKRNLQKYSNLGKTILVPYQNGANPQKRFISIDRDTNEVVSASVDSLKLGRTFKGIDLEENPLIKIELESGKRVFIEGLMFGNRKIDSFVQYNAADKKFDFDMSREFRQALNSDIITKEMTRFNYGREGFFYRGKEFTLAQIEKLSKGESLLIADFETKTGHVYSAYLSFNEKTESLVQTSPSKLEKSISTSQVQSAPKEETPQIKDEPLEEVQQPEIKKGITRRR